MINEKCPECGGVLTFKNGKFGLFVSCINWSRCKFHRDLDEKEKEKYKLEYVIPHDLD
jgi:DNA topoisomerase-1